MSAWESGPGYPHGANLRKKLQDNAPTTGAGKAAREIEPEYLAWRNAAEAVAFSPSSLKTFATKHTSLFNTYRDFLDDAKFDKAFDSRGALLSSALEEFCRQLFAPMVAVSVDEGDVDLGHHNVFQGMFFTAPDFKSFAELPEAHFPKVNMDFVIAKRVSVGIEDQADRRQTATVHLPAVAVECKTYLDRTRYHGADGNATTVKAGFPGCLYVVLAEMLKLDLDSVNVHGSRIDHIYVLRRSKNVDLKKRRKTGKKLKPIHEGAVVDLTRVVYEHLSEDWSEPGDWEASGRLK